MGYRKLENYAELQKIIATDMLLAVIDKINDYWIDGVSILETLTYRTSSYVLENLFVLESSGNVRFMDKNGRLLFEFELNELQSVGLACEDGCINLDILLRSKKISISFQVAHKMVLISNI